MNKLFSKLQRDRESYLLSKNWVLRNMLKKTLVIIFLILIFIIMPQSLLALNDGPKPDIVISKKRGFQIKGKCGENSVYKYAAYFYIKNIGQSTAFSVSGEFRWDCGRLKNNFDSFVEHGGKTIILSPGETYCRGIFFERCKCIEPTNFRCLVSTKNEPQELQVNNMWVGNIQFEPVDLPPAEFPFPPAEFPQLPPAEFPNRPTNTNACLDEARSCMIECERKFPPGSYSVTTQRQFKQCKENCDLNYFKCTHQNP